MKWRGLPGDGKVSTVHWSMPRLRSKQSVVTRPTGEKKGSKRHLLTDGRGVPLSIVVAGANRHDVTQLELVLDEIVIERPEYIKQHLCADKGYSGKPAVKAMTDRNYIPHVRKRGEEIQEKEPFLGTRPAAGWLK